MANVSVPLTELVSNNKTADPAGTSFTASGNTGVIADSVPERLMLRVAGGATAGNFLLKAGSNPPYPSASQGDLTVAFGASATVWVGPLTSARFKQADGSLQFTASQNCTVTAFSVPRDA